jgi:hypothetical protein
MMRLATLAELQTEAWHQLERAGKVARFRPPPQRRSNLSTSR